MISDEEKRRMANILRNTHGTFEYAHNVWLDWTLLGLNICSKTRGELLSGLWHIAAYIDPGEERTCKVLHVGTLFDGLEYRLSCGHKTITLDDEEPVYCSTCGAKVVQE